MLLHWVGRFSFTFLILAFLLGWQGRKLDEAGDQRNKVRLYYAGSAVCLVAGMIGVRLRHRDNQHEPDPADADTPRR